MLVEEESSDSNVVDMPLPTHTDVHFYLYHLQVWSAESEDLLIKPTESSLFVCLGFIWFDLAFVLLDIFLMV